MPRHSGHTTPLAKNRRQSLRPEHGGSSDLRRSWDDDARTLLRTSLAMADRGQSIIAGEAGTGGTPYHSGPRPKDLPVASRGGETAASGGRVGVQLPTPARRPNPKTRKRRALAKAKGVASAQSR
jgi:hypothetical protein